MTAYSSLIEAAESRLNRDVMDGDHMYSPQNPARYFQVGASAMQCIQSCMQMASVSHINSILDFACGSGRVARWLRAAFPAAILTVSDLNPESINWLGEKFDALAWKSSHDLSSLQAPRQFDLIWCGSLVTHLPEEASAELCKRFASWLAPGGIAVVTTHGRKVLEKQRAKPDFYMPADLFQHVIDGYCRTGFGYANYPRRSGIGISVSTPEWVARTLRWISGIRQIAYAEAGWDDHQDVFAFQRIS